MTGVVTAGREAIVRVRLRSLQGQEVDIDTVLDTGFTESLSLPQTWVDTLALPLIELNEMTLADGSVIPVEVYEGRVIWDRHEHTIVIHCVEGSPLLGMFLLYDYLLTIQVVAGGSVTITALA
jgi:Predicted aspartyl protease